MIAAGADLLAELGFMRIAAEVGVQRKRDKMLGDIFRLDLFPGEPPGTIRRASPSRS
jgi:hypothetical protein